MRSPLISAVAALALVSPLSAQSPVECQPPEFDGYLSIAEWVDHADGPQAAAPALPDAEQWIFGDAPSLAPGQPLPPPTRAARGPAADGESLPPPWIAAGWIVLDPDLAGSAVRPVPEPSAIFLIGMGVAALIRRRRLA